MILNICFNKQMEAEFHINSKKAWLHCPLCQWFKMAVYLCGVIFSWYNLGPFAPTVLHLNTNSISSAKSQQQTPQGTLYCKVEDNIREKKQQLDEDEHSDSGTEKLLFSSKTPMADAGSEKGSHLQWPVGGEGRKIAPRTHCGRESQPSWVWFLTIFISLWPSFDGCSQKDNPPCYKAQIMSNWCLEYDNKLTVLK